MRASYSSRYFEEAAGNTLSPCPVPIWAKNWHKRLRKSWVNFLHRSNGAIQRGKVSLDELDRFARLAPSGIRKSGPEKAL